MVGAKHSEMNRKIISLPKEYKRRISIEVNSNQPLFINKLFSLKPDFIGVTWIGNFEDVIVEDIPPIKMAQTLISNDFIVLLHIPCRNLSKKSAVEILEVIKSIGVRNILVLKGQSAFIKEKDDSKVDFPYAGHFVEFVKQTFDDYFAIGVAGYPYKHPSSLSIAEDMNYLRDKVSKGADFIVTQASFDESMYETFHERCLLYSIDIPIFAGSIILKSPEEFHRIRRLCKITDRCDIKEFVENEDGNEQIFGRRKFVELGRKILGNRNFAGIHVFSVNNSMLNNDSLIDVVNELLEVER
ncbi:hypothetical protein WA026_000642 [Henosepilachna vigintioctopunctata]|uniref:Methylenetetrahydrofolate reductase (NAD(P)H) n=1 Tax=Henosepilachna vigintioctopunctata TaxID=420089 RepID=A0AAW1V866_9CUCU